MSDREGELFQIQPVSGYAETVGHLVSMLDYARRGTLLEIAGLQMSQLDYLLDEQANSIGMLLEHIASVEESYQRSTFGWEMEASHQRRWRLGAELGPEARLHVKGQPLEYYADRLKEARRRTRQELSRRDDSWLFEVGPMGRNMANNYFKWFHVVEEELGHTAQIRLISRRLQRE